MNKKQISYKCKIDFYENEDCDDTEFIDLIKPKLYQSYYYDTNIKLDVQDVFSYEYIITFLHIIWYINMYFLDCYY